MQAEIAEAVNEAANEVLASPEPVESLVSAAAEVAAIAEAATNPADGAVAPDAAIEMKPAYSLSAWPKKNAKVTCPLCGEKHICPSTTAKRERRHPWHKPENIEWLRQHKVAFGITE